METIKIDDRPVYRVTQVEIERSGGRPNRARIAARASQFIDYGFAIIYSLLTIRLGLNLIAADSSSGFVQFIRGITNPFYEPFRGIVPSPTLEGGNSFQVPILIAIVAYAILHVGINGLLRMVAKRKVAI
jgi:uncharacterized protein YggT (Ycf19 family)